MTPKKSPPTGVFPLIPVFPTPGSSVARSVDHCSGLQKPEKTAGRKIKGRRPFGRICLLNVYISHIYVYIYMYMHVCVCFFEVALLVGETEVNQTETSHICVFCSFLFIFLWGGCVKRAHPYAAQPKNQTVAQCQAVSAENRLPGSRHRLLKSHEGIPKIRLLLGPSFWTCLRIGSLAQGPGHER